MLEEFVSDAGRDLCTITEGKRVFVCDDHSVCFLNRRGNGVPNRGKRSQIDDLPR